MEVGQTMSKRSVVSFVTFSVAITLVLGLIPWLWFGSFDGAGSLGDWIAGSSTLIVQAVVIYLLYETYRSQKSELEEQRMLLDVANKEAARKRFEDGYYMLLNRYEAVVSRLKEPDNDYYRVRRVFPAMSDECLSYLKGNDAQEALAKFFHDRDWWLGDWLRAVKMVVKYVRESDRTDREQHEYLKLLRGSMSAAEAQTLLLYLASMERGNSPTAIYLLSNNFFKYSYISQRGGSELLDKHILDLHGLRIYPTSGENAAIDSSHQSG
jgi:hypothetical protein